MKIWQLSSEIWLCKSFLSKQNQFLYLFKFIFRNILKVFLFKYYFISVSWREKRKSWKWRLRKQLKPEISRLELLKIIISSKSIIPYYCCPTVLSWIKVSIVITEFKRFRLAPFFYNISVYWKYNVSCKYVFWAGDSCIANIMLNLLFLLIWRLI